MIILSKKSLERIHTCKPALRTVILEAANTAPPELDFTVLEGVRTREQMCINYGKGRTAGQLAAKRVPAHYARPSEKKVTWLNNPFASAHAADPADGLSKAIDVAPWPIDWNDSKRFELLADHILGTANDLGIMIRWGRDWDMDGRYEEKGETDGPHFELV